MNIRFYGFNKPAIGRAGRRVCYREHASGGEFIELADNLIAFDWGLVPGGKLPRLGAKELAMGLCIASLPNEVDRAKGVYMRFRQRYVDGFPDDWSVTDADIKRAIVSIEEAYGEEARRAMRVIRPERVPTMTDAGGLTSLGSRIVWDTDLDARQIVPNDPDDFVWQPAPFSRRA